jgi:NADH dehydrogenase
VPGAAEFTFPIAEFESARRLRTRLARLPVDAPVTVVGGGLTGVETAAELAEQGRTVTLVCGGTLVSSWSAPGRRYATRWLSRHGVAVLETDVATELRPDAYRGQHLAGDFLVEISNGMITNFYAIRNPDKLVAFTGPRQISR